MNPFSDWRDINDTEVLVAGQSVRITVRAHCPLGRADEAEMESAMNGGAVDIVSVSRGFIMGDWTITGTLNEDATGSKLRGDSLRAVQATNDNRLVSCRDWEVSGLETTARSLVPGSVPAAIQQVSTSVKYIAVAIIFVAAFFLLKEVREI